MGLNVPQKAVTQVSESPHMVCSVHMVDKIAGGDGGIWRQEGERARLRSKLRKIIPLLDCGTASRYVKH